MYPISWTRQKQLRFAGLVLSNRSEKPFSTSCKSSSETKTTTTIQKGSAEKKSNSLKSQIIPNSFEVQSLVTTICDTSSIAEFELKLSGFRLYVTRDLSGKSEPPPPSNSVRTSSSITAETHDLNGSVSTPSLAISKSVPSSGGIQTLLDKAVDEGLVILQSPRVGFFRRSRTIKGKRAPLSCKEACSGYHDKPLSMDMDICVVLADTVRHATFLRQMM
ncbi:uncharacterized protein LOC122090698 isoform X2 [Macadamia integrifolia]|uniref:uncharacterized protein LOC122090698 isoform X2 n=1 Tax=Macadamia integrifolia TaxID=60698 RepID=UPI001C4FE7A5|nr:uncharacterized protein LOC122090698 isoform X2 [Macadamia integrifolia]